MIKYPIFMKLIFVTFKISLLKLKNILFKSIKIQEDFLIK